MIAAPQLSLISTKWVKTVEGTAWRYSGGQPTARFSLGALLGLRHQSDSALHPRPPPTNPSRQQENPYNNASGIEQSRRQSDYLFPPSRCCSSNDAARPRVASGNSRMQAARIPSKKLDHTKHEDEQPP